MGRSDREREEDRGRFREPRERSERVDKVDRVRESYSKERRHDVEENWRDVRIKDEPMSDAEGHRDRPDRRHPSDIKLKSQSRSRRDRSPERRSRSRSRDRERGRHREESREDSRRVSNSPPAHSRGSNEERHRSSGSHPHGRHDRGEGRGGDRGRDSRGGRGRPAREQDWDNFFNPNSKIKVETEDEDSKFGKKGDGKDEPKKDKEKPNFGLSGKLTEETNKFRRVVIKYSEPPEARKPQKIRWRLYPFKGDESLPVMYIHRQSAYLLGRERKIADIPIDHPSCSKQHAVIQFRLVPYTRPNGTKGRRIKPYIIDLESGNGTYVNGVQIEPKRYVELFEKDVLKFGYSTREYVILNEHTKADQVDDDEPAGSSPEVDEKVRIKAEQGMDE